MGATCHFVVVILSTIAGFLLLGPCSGDGIPASFIFGDSLVDAGNNNYIASFSKANFAPNGIDLIPYCQPTGRYTNGRTIADILGQELGLESFTPPYLAPTTVGSAVLNGVNYGSGGGGILNETGEIFGGRINFDAQIDDFANTRQDIISSIGETATSELLSKAIFSVTMGSNDFINNYLTPVLSVLERKFVSPEMFVEAMISRYRLQLTRLYNLGARKIIVVNVGPIGCIPYLRDLNPSAGDNCVAFPNQLAQTFNERLKSLVLELSSSFEGTLLVYADVYRIVWDIIQNFDNYGDDFWFQDPNGDPMGVYWLQGVHMIHCAYNSMWMGQIIQPDWDMFQSDHLCAKFHAGSRAICGGPIYVSDSVGSHDFDLIKKLVFADGTIPKCQHFALPTRDCLFKNPLFDGQTILKIWNINKFGGVIGAFNCQGAGWDPKEQRIKGYSQCYKPMSGIVHVTDIEWEQKKEASEMGNAEEYAVYLNQAEEILLVTPKSDAIHMTIQPSSFEIFSFVPIKKFGADKKFAPIGLINMFNSGGTLQEVEYGDIEDEIRVKIKVKGAGKFLAYSSGRPKKSSLDGVEVGFEWCSADGKLILDLPCGEECGISEVGFTF